MHPTLAGLYPFLLGSPARCAFLLYFMFIICLGSPARSQLSHPAVALTGMWRFGWGQPRCPWRFSPTEMMGFREVRVGQFWQKKLLWWCLVVDSQESAGLFTTGVDVEQTMVSVICEPRHVWFTKLSSFGRVIRAVVVVIGLNVVWSFAW